MATKTPRVEGKRGEYVWGTCRIGPTICKSHCPPRGSDGARTTAFVDLLTTTATRPRPPTSQNNTPCDAAMSWSVSLDFYQTFYTKTDFWVFFNSNWFIGRELIKPFLLPLYFKTCYVNVLCKQNLPTRAVFPGGRLIRRTREDDKPQTEGVRVKRLFFLLLMMI